MSAPEPPDTLTGWKEIAEYLGKSVRTAHRWKAELGLPVRRVTAADGTETTVASRREIDAWRQRQAPEEEPPASTPRRWSAAWNRLPRQRAAAALGIVAAGVITGVAIATTFIPPTRIPERFDVDGTTVRAATADDATVWAYDLGATGRRPDTMTYTVPAQGDLDGDGSPEVAVAVTFAQRELPSEVSDAVYLFGRDGRLRWKIQPPARMEVGGETFDGPWRLRDTAFSSTGSGRVWIAYSHDQPGRPSFILEATADGTQTLRYLQTGVIQTVTHFATSSTDVIAVGGTDAATSLPSVVLLPRHGAAARWPADTPDMMRCPDCPRLPPDAVFLFPLSELNRLRPTRTGFVYRMLTIGGRLRIETDDGGRPGLLAWVAPEARVAAVQRTPRFWTTHQGLEAEGRIDHSAEQCPERHAHVPIRAWRPASGWTEYAVIPSSR